MERICRLCLTSETDREFEKIFGNQSQIALKIFLISQVKIIELENNAALICDGCLKEIYQCFVFIRKIQTSNEYFQSKLDVSLWKIYDEEFCKQEDVEENVLKIEALDSSFNNELECEYEALDEAEINDIQDNTVSEPQESPKPSRRGRKIKSIKRPYNRLTCKICGMTLSRRQRLVQHERLHFIESTKSFYECDKCGKQFNQRFSIIPHFQKHHNYKLGHKERWRCAICEEKTVPACKMDIHYRKFHPEFHSDQSLQRSSVQPKKEPYRNVAGFKKSPQKKTIKSDPVDKDWFICSLCGNSFTCNYRFNKHLNDIHGVTEHDIVQKEESSAVILNQKELKSSKNVPCLTCGKAFATVSTCKAHEKTHLNTSFICDLCGKSFKIKAYLTAHVLKIHIKLKRFKCTICSKEFIHRELLNYHVRKHLNIRNYSCQFCQKTFVRKACMLIHERIHVNLRPYSCKYCDRTFSHHSDHKRHEQRHIVNDIAFKKN